MTQTTCDIHSKSQFNHQLPLESIWDAHVATSDLAWPFHCLAGTGLNLIMIIMMICLHPASTTLQVMSSQFESISGVQMIWVVFSYCFKGRMPAKLLLATNDMSLTISTAQFRLACTTIQSLPQNMAHAWCKCQNLSWGDSVSHFAGGAEYCWAVTGWQGLDQLDNWQMVCQASTTHNYHYYNYYNFSQGFPPLRITNTTVDSWWLKGARTQQDTEHILCFMAHWQWWDQKWHTSFMIINSTYTQQHMHRASCGMIMPWLNKLPIDDNSILLTIRWLRHNWKMHLQHVDCTRWCGVEDYSGWDMHKLCNMYNILFNVWLSHTNIRNYLRWLMQVSYKVDIERHTANPEWFTE